MTVFLRFKSALDGVPLLLAFSGGKGGRSKNRKTGGIIQSWIMRDRVDPQKAIKSGKDSSICGNCARRWFLGGDCYVVVGRGPLAVWRGIKGWYKNAKAKRLNLANPPKSLVGQFLRLGSYGDPAAVPFDLWNIVFQVLRPRRHTGYTHQWKECDPRFKRILMASVDSPEEKLEAQAHGWRTFRVRAKGDPILPGEIECPASAEQGHRLTCETCGACDGGAPPKASVTIIAHGVKNKHGNAALKTC